MRKIIAVAMTLFFASLFSSAQADTIQYENLSVAKLTALAKQGEARAQFDLGNIYRSGQGVAQSYKEAMAWYRKAAEQGNAQAQFSLGDMYLNGQAVTQNYKEAAMWYRKAAEQGLAYAQINLGKVHNNGQGVTQDHKVVEQGQAEPPSVEDNSRQPQSQPKSEQVAQPSPKPSSGSLWTGIWLAGLIVLIGHVGTLMFFKSPGSDALFLITLVHLIGDHVRLRVLLWPEAISFIVAIVLFMNGKSRTGSGMLIGTTCVMVAWLAWVFYIAVISEGAKHPMAPRG